MADAFDKGRQEGDARGEGAAVTAEAFDGIFPALGHDLDRAKQDDHRQGDQDKCDDFHVSLE